MQVPACFLNILKISPNQNIKFSCEQRWRTWGGAISEVRSVQFSKRKIFRLIDFQALDPKFHLALEPKVLKLKGSSFRYRSSIQILKGWYEEPPKKVPITKYLFWNAGRQRVKQIFQNHMTGWIRFSKKKFNAFWEQIVKVKEKQ